MTTEEIIEKIGIVGKYKFDKITYKWTDGINTVDTEYILNKIKKCIRDNYDIKSIE